jgi:hypothetical protein
MLTVTFELILDFLTSNPLLNGKGLASLNVSCKTKFVKAVFVPTMTAHILVNAAVEVTVS